MMIDVLTKNRAKKFIREELKDIEIKLFKDLDRLRRRILKLEETIEVKWK